MLIEVDGRIRTGNKVNDTATVALNFAFDAFDFANVAGDDASGERFDWRDSGRLFAGANRFVGREEGEKTGEYHEIVGAFFNVTPRKNDFGALMEEALLGDGVVGVSATVEGADTVHLDIAGRCGSTDTLTLTGAYVSSFLAANGLVAGPELVRITNGNAISLEPVISADGGTVVFESEASDLIPGDPDSNGNKRDIFLYDVATRTTTRLTDGNGGSFQPQVSADGGRVVFWSDASDLIPGDPDANGDTSDIFLYDVAASTTTRLTDGNGSSFFGDISADGGTVVFMSGATDLIPGDTDANGDVFDVFLYDVATGGITRLTNGNLSSTYEPAISDDGGTVLFTGSASDLIPGDPDTNGFTQDVFLYDVATGTITRLSDGNGASYSPVLSADGGTAGFNSSASDLIPGDPDPNGDVEDFFLYDVATGTTTRPTDGNAGSGRPVLSADGGTVAFNSFASDLIPGDPDDNGDTRDAFLFDVATGTTRRITDGNADSFVQEISADGGTVVFSSRASDLISGDPDRNGGIRDVFIYDVATGTTTRLTDGNDDSSAFYNAISADGDTLVFRSDASDLIDGDSDINNTSDIFLATLA